jgi:hypothetical protein
MLTGMKRIIASTPIFGLRRFRQQALALCLFGALIAGCGGGSGGSKALKFDPAKADTLAHVAMPSARDLPGGGWKVTSVDEFDDDEDLSAFEGIKVCDGYVKVRKSIYERVTPKLSGRAKQSLEQAGSPALLPLSADFEVSIYAETSVVTDAFKEIDKTLSGSTFNDCVVAVYQSAMGSGASAKMVPPSTTKVDGGYAFAAEVSLGQGGGTLRFESHAWPEGNARASVDIAGVKSEVTGDFVKAAIAQAQKGLERAASPNPGTPAPAVVITPTAPRQAASNPTAAGGGASGFSTLASLKSYRYAVRIAGSGGPLASVAAQLASLSPTPTAGQAAAIDMKVTGVYVAPNRGQFKIDLGSLAVTVTTIGNQQWSALGTIVGNPKTISPAGTDFSFVAQLWDDSFINIVGLFGLRELHDANQRCSGEEMRARQRHVRPDQEAG